MIAQGLYDPANEHDACGVGFIAHGQNVTLILEDAGFRCHEAMDGDTAIVLLEEQADNTILLFSDVEMPGSINGFALARHVAQHWPWIEIVIASGNICRRLQS